MLGCGARCCSCSVVLLGINVESLQTQLLIFATLQDERTRNRNIASASLAMGPRCSTGYGLNSVTFEGEGSSRLRCRFFVCGRIVMALMSVFTTTGNQNLFVYNSSKFGRRARHFGETEGEVAVELRRGSATASVATLGGAARGISVGQYTLLDFVGSTRPRSLNK